MNERIQELAEQAKQYANSMYPSGLDIPKWGPAYHEKFAQLIVKECLGKIENEAAQYAEPVWAFELVNDIKEHFGVEE